MAVTLLDDLLAHLVGAGLVRRGDVAGDGERPWLPPAWRHPDEGPIGPGDAAQEHRAPATHDDGLVVSLLWAPGLVPAPGAEDIRQDGVDIVMRGVKVPAIVELEAAIRAELVGTLDPGGRADWIMGSRYVIQARMWRPMQPLTTDGAYTFTVGYVFETRV